MINNKIAVVIPSYKVTDHILTVIAGIGKEVEAIYVIDDKCPNGSGQLVVDQCSDPRVTVIFNKINTGVGGAVLTGYQAAISAGCKIIVKIDGDGQMDTNLIQKFVEPIIHGQADYTKGNRFYHLDKILNMPLIRLFGNSVLSFLTKISSGYWGVFDPTNGFTAIHTDVAIDLPFNKISKRYFFETDMLFRLNLLRAVVVDVPMDAKYENETSNLRIKSIIFEFLLKHCKNLIKRIFYNYYLRDMSVASFELPLGIFLVLWGSIFGSMTWIDSSRSGIETPAGSVMLAALPIIVGLQFLLAFLSFDIANVPRRPIHSNGNNLI